MPKPRPSPKHNRPKKYDFETPLDPFQGESLKGIAAFIESSLTLKPDANVEDTGAESLTPVSSEPSTIVPGTLDTAILGTPITSEPSTPNLGKPSVLDSFVSSVPNITVPSTPITNGGAELLPLESGPDLRKSSVLDSAVSSVPNMALPSAPMTNRDAELPVGSEPDLDKSGVLDSVVSSVPNMAVPSTPTDAELPYESDTDQEPAKLIPSTLSALGKAAPSPPTPFLAPFTDRSELSVLDTSSVDDQPGRAATPATPQRVIELNVRTAARGQDGLNKGEQKIYTFLWRAVYRPKEMAKSEFKTTTDTIEISLRDLAKRVDLGLANCAWHMRCLEEKGCIVRVRESDHYHPAVYRVREFTEILQWRKNRGLTHFIQRGHLAAFVDPRIGTPITRFRGQTGTTYRGKVIMSTPDRAHAGVLSMPELSTPDTGVVAVNSSTPAVPDSSTEGVSDLNTPLLREEQLTKDTSNLTSSSFALPPPQLIDGLHQLLPVFDNEAATILWNDCRTKAADCTVEEVLHFSEVKAASFRTGKIQNPTGFLLVTVPKCFEGQAFKAFREQERKRRAEQQRREEEELVKAQMLEEELRLEQETYRQAEESLASLPAEEYQALFQQKRKEYLAMFPKTRSWKPETLDESIRARIVREFQKEILRNRPS